MPALLLCLMLAGGVEDHVQALRSDRAAERFAAAAALGALGADAKSALPALVAALSDSESAVRKEAGRALVRVGARVKDIPKLLQRLESGDFDVAQMICEALGDLGAQAVAPLVAVLESDNDRFRSYVVTALTLCGRHGAEALPALLDRMTDENPGVAAKAAEAVRRIGPWCTDQVPDIVDRARFGEPRTRWAAIHVLARIGPAARDALPALRDLLKDDSGRIRDAAAEAIRALELRTVAQAHPALRKPQLAREHAPAKFRVRLDTTRGAIEIECKREWAPHGVDRFYNLVKIGYFDDVAIFRVVEGFVAQFGIHGSSKVNTAWMEANIKDDKVAVSNRRGWVTFAMAGKDTRTTQLFFNLADNAHLDKSGFAPIGRVATGLKVVDTLFSGYGEKPDQEKIYYEGNAYLDREFPRLDYIRRAVLLK